MDQSQNVTALFSQLLQDDFNDGNFVGWTLVDQGTSNAPSNWSAATGTLRQSSNIFAHPTDRASLPKLGTYAWYPAGLSWTDYGVTLTMRSQDDDALGVMVRYQDPNNYYRFSWDKQRTYRRLVKVENGLFTLLAEEAVAYVTGQTYQIEIQASGAALEVRVDGALLFGGPVTDSTTPLTTGSVALYSWANNGSHFDDVEVSTVGPPQVLTVTLAGSGTGTVTSDVAGITCPGDCTEGYTGRRECDADTSPGRGLEFYRLEWRLHGHQSLCRHDDAGAQCHGDV